MASPALAPPDVKDVTLALFAGRKTDIAPSDLPEGLTPDEQDGIYLPGQWQSRPGLARLYALGKLPAGAKALYEKTYVQPNGDPLTLVLTSDGQLWVEDVGNFPGTLVSTFPVTPGLYSQSVTEFGREYIAFSDLLHGQGIPLQYDGTNLDRVTMDGPAATPTVADSIVNYTAPGIALGAGLGLLCSLTETGNTVTGTTSTAHGLLPGESVFVAKAAVAGYNGIYPVLTVPSSTTFTYQVNPTGLANSSGEVQQAIGGLSTSTVPNPLPLVGDAITISGTGLSWDNSALNSPPVWIIIAAVPSGSGYQITFDMSTANPAGTYTDSSGEVSIGGMSSVGVHQIVCMWLTRQGAITAPSPALSFNSVGNSKFKVSDLAIGPANVIARVLGFAGSGGDNFFIIPASVTLPNPTNPLGTPIVVESTVVPDNTSTSWFVDFNDNTLFAAVPIDQIGNDLFDQVVLGPVLGFFAYASRLSCWGDYNKVENFLNMGYCGSDLNALTAPSGWSASGNNGGTLVDGGPWAAGVVWQITGDGSPNKRGLLTQSAYQDSFGDAIVSPSTYYSFRLWAKASAAGLAGTLFFTLTSVLNPEANITGFLAISQIANGVGGFVPLTVMAEGMTNIPLQTPATIPTDYLLSVYATGLPLGATIQIGEQALIFSEDPYRNNLSRWSYVDNPEAFAQTTGQLGPDDDDSPIRCFALLRQSSLLETAEGVHIFEDTTSEPGDWNVNQLTRAVGAVSLKAGDPGKFGTGDGAEDFAVIASKNGAYLFAGSEFWKVSQEISRGSLAQAQDPRKCWDDITWSSSQTIVAKNDPATRRAYFAVPLNGALTPNCVFALDYREMDTAAQIAQAPPLHITIQGKMKSSDLTRKWSVWNVAANDIEILLRPGNNQQVFFASGNGAVSGNLYSLNPANLSDDDFGQIFPYYTTYFFTDHDQEQALQLGADSKLVKQVHSFVTGVGQVIITPIVNSLYNFLPSLSPRILVSDTDASNFLADDLEWTTQIRGDRIAFRISVIPLPGSTDVQVRLQKFIAHMMKDPIAVTRQSGI